MVSLELTHKKKNLNMVGGRATAILLKLTHLIELDGRSIRVADEICDRVARPDIYLFMSVHLHFVIALGILLCSYAVTHTVNRRLW